MITEANLPALMRCVTNNEKAQRFDLSTYRHDCGTYGCLVGNDSIALGIDEPEMYGRYSGHIVWGIREYGIMEDNNICPGGESLWSFLFGYYHRTDVTREACLNRLRKFIYYVAHKRELLYDDSGRVRETARRAEGDHHVLRQVKKRVEAECAGV